MKPQIPWLRVFVEGVVIVGSILLALALDAWWDGRQATQLEAQVLATVTDEVAENQTLLRDHLDFVGAMRDRTDRFLRFDSAALAALPPDSLRPFMEAPQRPQTFDALTAAASLLTQTPALSSEGVRIRALVSGLLTQVEDAREEREEFREASRDVREHLSEYASRASSAGGGTIGEMIERLGPAVLAEVRADDRLVRLVVQRTTILTLYTYELERVGIALDSLEAALQPAKGHL